MIDRVHHGRSSNLSRLTKQRRPTYQTQNVLFINLTCAVIASRRLYGLKLCVLLILSVRRSHR
jgi:hypothetical protein